MTFLDPSQPLGLPKGSIRGLIALAVVGAAIYAELSGVEVGRFILPTAALVVGEYLGRRAAS